MSIQLPPSDDTNALTNAIETATSTSQPLVLLPGIHFTKPGYNLKIPIGPNGLNLSGTAAGRIQRPDHSIGNNPLHRTDHNFGIFLVPSKPTTAEVAGIQWQTHQSGQDRFEYGILTRGKGESGEYEWVFRMYNRDRTAENPPRPNRISFYVFTPEGGLGVGSFFQDVVTKGDWIHVVGAAGMAQTYLYKDGVYRRCDTYRGPATSDCPTHKDTGGDQLIINPQPGSALCASEQGILLAFSKVASAKSESGAVCWISWKSKVSLPRTWSRHTDWLPNTFSRRRRTPWPGTRRAATMEQFSARPGRNRPDTNSRHGHVELMRF